MIGFWKFLPQNPKIFGLRTEGLFIGPSKEFGAFFFLKMTPSGKKTKSIDGSGFCPNVSATSVTTLYYVFPAEL